MKAGVNVRIYERNVDTTWTSFTKVVGDARIVPHNTTQTNIIQLSLRVGVYDAILLNIDLNLAKDNEIIPR